MTDPSVSETLVRVNYSETDQMGVAYHARYLVWLDIARTEHLRGCGASYRELEARGAQAGRERGRDPVPPAGPVRRPGPGSVLGAGHRLPEGRVRLRGRACRRRPAAGDGHRGLLALDTALNLARLPPEVRRVLHAVPDPVKLGFTTETQRPQSETE